VKAAAALALFACAAPACAWQLDDLAVAHDGARYRLTLDVRLDAARDRAFAVFSDFRNLPRINDAVEEISFLPGAADGATRLFTRVRICVAWFCKRLHQVQDIVRDDRDGGLGLAATVLPQFSNLRYGDARWTMRDCASVTCLHFSAEIEPDFWVPPLIGPWLMQRKMRSEAIQTSQGIERLAHGT
jgi:hypothetical protein